VQMAVCSNPAGYTRSGSIERYTDGVGYTVNYKGGYDDRRTQRKM